jgi:hypothetical protein
LTDYSKVTNFTAKDSLSSGDPNKIINGSLFDAEFDPIAIAVASKINKVAGETGEIPKFTSSGQLESSGFTPANISFVSGTVMSFFQSAAPTGWTQVTTHNDAMLRVVSTAGGGSGGTVSPISLAAHVHTTAGHVLTIAEMPAHTHTYRKGDGNDQNMSSGDQSYEEILNADTGSTGGGGSHTHGNTGSAGAFTPKYLDMILASKD